MYSILNPNAQCLPGIITEELMLVEAETIEANLMIIVHLLFITVH